MCVYQLLGEHSADRRGESGIWLCENHSEIFLFLCARRISQAFINNWVSCFNLLKMQNTHSADRYEPSMKYYQSNFLANV